MFQKKTEAWDEVEEDLKKRFPKNWAHLLNGLKTLRSQIRMFLETLSKKDVLQQIDMTIPALDPKQVSYRYPFFDPSTQQHQPIAPAEYTDWDTYQGEEQQVIDAIEDLLRAANGQVNVGPRGEGRPR